MEGAVGVGSGGIVGVPVGEGVGVRVGVTLGLGLSLGLGDSLPVGEGLADSDSLGLAEGLSEVVALGSGISVGMIGVPESVMIMVGNCCGSGTSPCGPFSEMMVTIARPATASTAISPTTRPATDDCCGRPGSAKASPCNGGFGSVGIASG